MQTTGCDGVAVGRGALGNPWIFEEIHAMLQAKNYTPPSKSERIHEALCPFFTNGRKQRRVRPIRISIIQGEWRAPLGYAEK